MAIYDLKCTNELCGFEFEVLQRYGDPLHSCPTCGADTERLISPCGWRLEGDGWYNPHQPMKRAAGGCPNKTDKKDTTKARYKP